MAYVHVYVPVTGMRDASDRAEAAADDEGAAADSGAAAVVVAAAAGDAGASLGFQNPRRRSWACETSVTERKKIMNKRAV